jgi:hypothetical protein
MGKRSQTFERISKDLYETPADMVAPLLPHLRPSTRFIEPCVGRGSLRDALTRAGHVCVGAYDLPTDARIHDYGVEDGEKFITNPPYHGRRHDLHPLIANLSDQAPFWALLPGDWLFNASSAPMMTRLRKIVVIGRAKWFPGTKHNGMENMAWMLFDRPSLFEPVFFINMREPIGCESGRLQGTRRFSTESAAAWLRRGREDGRTGRRQGRGDEARPLADEAATTTTVETVERAPDADSNALTQDTKRGFRRADVRHDR